MFVTTMESDTEIYLIDGNDYSDKRFTTKVPGEINCGYPEMPKFIGGNGERQFYFDCAGIHAPAVQAVVNSDTKENAIMYFQNYYIDRFKNRNIILGNVWEVIDCR